jgi:two-component system chemotaxis sensor kinase CheA
VVDRVIGEHQTVIKSLGKVYQDVRGISGATIKGDGSMALILDIPSLIA